MARRRGVSRQRQTVPRVLPGAGAVAPNQNRYDDGDQEVEEEEEEEEEGEGGVYSDALPSAPLLFFLWK